MDANSRAWKRFFEHTDCLTAIQRYGYCIISANDLKTIAKREPRLLAKQDTLKSVPQIFREHRLSILPVQNGRYILFHDDAQRSFFRFSEEHFEIEIEQYTSKVDLLSFDAFPDNGVLNESQALDVAYVSSLLSHFTEDHDLHLVIRGRQYAHGFQFYLHTNQIPVEVSSVQIEIDAGYETDRCLYLIEAKIGKRDDFNIRQLFYPYLEWSRRTHKEVRPIFLTYTNGKFYFTEFQFGRDYGTLRIRQARAFTINESPRPNVSISELMNRVIEGQEPTVPYPQADDLDKVVDVVRLASEGIFTSQTIADYFEFDPRQGGYYGNAAKYLDLLTTKDNELILTDFGKRFLATRSLEQRTRMLLSKLLERPTFRHSITLWEQEKFSLSRDLRKSIAESIAAFTTLTGTTPKRRTSTVVSWLRWLQSNANLIP